jgi:hypothetical protein
MKVTLPLPPYTFRDYLKKDPKALAGEFEAIMLKQVLKEAFRPLMRGKSFHQRVYYDMFLEAVSRKLAEAGGVGLARYVLKSLEPFAGNDPSNGRRSLESMVSELVRRYGLPSWVSYIPLVESGYNPRAVSPKGAAGLWQLMPETARRYGLRVDGDVDERFDPVRSTHAALRYIRHLLEEFGRWDLVLVAYNWGEGNARKLKGLDLSRNLDKLPRETREYLLKFMKILR